MNSSNKEKEMPLVLAAVVSAGIIIILVTPILIPAVALGYMLHWSWWAKKRTRYLRAVMLISNFEILLFGGWSFLFQKYPEYLKKFITFMHTKIAEHSFFTETYIRNMLIILPIFVGVAFAVLFNYKLKPSKQAYSVLRKAAISLTTPIRFAASVFHKMPKRNFVRLLFATSLAFTLMLLPLTGVYLVFALLKAQKIGGALSLAYLITGIYSVFVFQRGQIDGDGVSDEYLSKTGDVEIGTIQQPYRKSLKLSWKDINHHIHILGQPGSGKSVLLRNFYAHKIMNEEGLLMIDLKADLDVLAEMQAFAQAANREKDLVVIDLSKPEASVGYNPLLRGGASELKDKIMSALDWSETYYQKISERFLLHIFNALVVVRDVQGLIPTLSDVFECLNYPEALETLSAKISKDNPIVAKDILELARELRDRRVHGELNGLRTDIEVMLKSNFGSILLDPNAIDLYEAIQAKKVVLVQLDGQTYRQTAVRFGRLLISDLRAASGAIVSNLNKSSRPKFTVIVDEFADIVSNEAMSEGFVSLLNRCRGSGIGVIIAHQSLGDFKDERSRTQVLDSTETTISFTQKDPNTCEILASIVGTKDKVSVTEQTDTFLGFGVKTGRGTEKRTQEFIFHPNEFRNLNVGEAIYIAKRPVRYGKVRIKNLTAPAVVGPLSRGVWHSMVTQVARPLALADNRSGRATSPAENGYEQRLASAVQQADI